MRNIPTKVDTVDNLSAAAFNSDQDELENVVTSADDTLDPANGPDTDLNMLGKAIAGYAGAGWAYQDSGSANAYVLSIASNLKPITKYFDNLMVAFKPGNANTGASTVNVGGLGVKDLKIAGADPLAGEILTSKIVILKYNLSSDYFEAVSGLKEIKPAFSASPSVAQSIPTATDTKIQWKGETYDTHNDFDFTTNYRYTPSIAGKYLFTVYLMFQTTVDNKDFYVVLQKSGVLTHRVQMTTVGSGQQGQLLTAIVEANGTTDYFEVYVYQNTGSSHNIRGESLNTYWMGCKID